MSWEYPDVVGDIRPSPVTGHTAIEYDGKLFVYGGQRHMMLFVEEYIDELFMFHIDTCMWSTPSSIQGQDFARARSDHSAVLIGDSHMVVIGGHNHWGTELDVAFLEIDAAKWYVTRISGEWPAPRHGHACIEYKDQIIMIGGVVDGNAVSEICALDFSAAFGPADEDDSAAAEGDEAEETVEIEE
eukprot:TRINITY_DN5883_c0_g2_i4.p2 TRINITY_DN5883_c0_g2~~TRINITY_DN5883_c0_g2_i4.p2  ORF type:complete len:186 (-),score=62.89 TRINITY_DN5883_c0_g2_i4:67-624(-)